MIDLQKMTWYTTFEIDAATTMELNYSFRPVLKKTQPLIVTICIAATGLVLLFVAGLWPYPALWQGLSICLLVTAVYLASHYLLTEYEYMIQTRMQGFDEEDETPTYDFVILKNSKVVVRVGLETVYELVWEEKGTVKKANRTYTYVAQWKPQKVCCLTYLDTSCEGGEPVRVRFLSDDVLFEYLKMTMNPDAK